MEEPEPGAPLFPVIETPGVFPWINCAGEVAPPLKSFDEIEEIDPVTSVFFCFP